MADHVVSADSHVIEDPHLWKQRLPEPWNQDAPVFPERGVGGPFQTHPGGWDPAARLDEMAVDGVSQEVLYPSMALMLFGSIDPGLQSACFRVYNDWITEYCAVAPDRLFGVAALSVHDIDHAIAELERGKEEGLVGAMLWQVPPDELSFATEHYDPLWAAAADLEMPVSLHSQTGVPYPWPRVRTTQKLLVNSARKSNRMTIEAANAVSDLITSGVLERFPQLRLVLVENEASWIPGFLSRYDNYYARNEESHRQAPSSTLTMEPSKYFDRQFSVTFFNDPTLGALFGAWGTDICMWSNDYPHANSTWPNSQKVIERDLGHLPPSDRRRLVAGNVSELYRLPQPHTSGGSHDD